MSVDDFGLWGEQLKWSQKLAYGIDQLWSCGLGWDGYIPEDGNFAMREFINAIPIIFCVQGIDECTIIGNKIQSLGNPAILYRYHDANAIIAKVATMSVTTLIE